MRHSLFFNTRLIVFALVFLTVGLAHTSRARAYTGQEIQLWTQAGIRADLTDDLELGLDQHARFYETINEVSRWYTEVQLEYDLPRHFEVAAAYRFIIRADKRDSCCRHRVNGDVTYSLDAAELLRFSARLRGQGTLRENEATLYIIRTRADMMMIRYKLVRPFISVELFERVLGPDGASFDTLRFDAGLLWRVMKDWKLETTYRFQIPATQDERLQHIISVATRYSFD